MTGSLPSTAAIKRAMRHCRLHARLMLRGLLEKDRHERAKQHEISGMNFVGELFGVGRHEPPISQFRSRVARLGNFIEHLDVAWSLSFQVEFERTPGAGCICDLNHCVTSF